MPDPSKLIEQRKQAEQALEQLVEHQRTKVLYTARAINDKLTPEDIRNPQDFPELNADPIFNYEDGVLSGLLSAQLAVRRALNE